MKTYTDISSLGTISLYRTIPSLIILKVVPNTHKTHLILIMLCLGDLLKSFYYAFLKPVLEKRLVQWKQEWRCYGSTAVYRVIHEQCSSQSTKVFTSKSQKMSIAHESQDTFLVRSKTEQISWPNRHYRLELSFIDD